MSVECDTLIRIPFMRWTRKGDGTAYQYFLLAQCFGVAAVLPL
jgi:hypothetical protein